MFTNAEIAKFRKTATIKALGLFRDNKRIRCDYRNIEDIVSEALTLLLVRWTRLERTAADLKDAYITNLLKAAAVELNYLPKNYGPRADMVGQTQCNDCYAEFDWKAARWSVKNGKRQNKAICPVCGAYLITCDIATPTNFISENDMPEGTYPQLVTPSIEQIICAERGSLFYQEQENDDVLTDQRVKNLLKPGKAPDWFERYVEFVMADELTQGEIAKELDMTEAKLSAELQQFKSEAQVIFNIPRSHRKAQTNPARKNTEQLGLFD